MISDFDQESKMKDYFITELNKGHILDWGQFYQHISQENISKSLLSKIQRWFDSIIKVRLLDGVNDDAEEVFIHNADSCFIKLNSCTNPFEHDFTQEDIDLTLFYLTLKQGKNWNLLNPYISFNIDINSKAYRATFIHQSLNPEGHHKAFFRILNSELIPIDSFDHSSTLIHLIQNKKNVLIAGSTGSGKTTLLNSLLSLTNHKEHTIILEDTYELSSPNQRTSRLLSGQKELDELLSYSLRMSPDRVVLGEIRAKEVLTFILGMNTGHKGMLSSIHANSAKDALSRVAILYATYASTKISYEMILKLICSNVDYVVYIENKKIIEIIEVFGAESSNIFFDTVH